MRKGDERRAESVFWRRNREIKCKGERARSYTTASVGLDSFSAKISTSLRSDGQTERVTKNNHPRYLEARLTCRGQRHRLPLSSVTLLVSSPNPVWPHRDAVATISPFPPFDADSLPTFFARQRPHHRKTLARIETRVIN